LILLILSTVL